MYIYIYIIYIYIYILELTRDITRGERTTRGCSRKRLLNKEERTRMKRDSVSQMQASQHAFRQQLIEYQPRGAQLLANAQPDTPRTKQKKHCAQESQRAE